MNYSHSVFSWAIIIFLSLSSLLPSSYALLFQSSLRSKVESLKSSIINEAKGTANGVTASAEKRALVMDLAKQLESTNREKKLCSTPILDGNWDLGK